MFLAVSRVFRGIMGCSRGVPGLFRAAPGCSGGVPGMFQGCSRGVPGCSGVFWVLQTPLHLRAQFSLAAFAVKYSLFTNRRFYSVKPAKDKYTDFHFPNLLGLKRTTPDS